MSAVTMLSTVDVEVDVWALCLSSVNGIWLGWVALLGTWGHNHDIIWSLWVGCPKCSQLLTLWWRLGSWFPCSRLYGFCQAAIHVIVKLVNQVAQCLGRGLCFSQVRNFGGESGGPFSRPICSPQHSGEYHDFSITSLSFSLTSLVGGN